MWFAVELTMVTKISTKCYRFSTVDFEPEKCRLLWKDKTVTNLTNEESQLLALLCHHAGEVLSSWVLLNATKPTELLFNPHQNTLYSLLAKSYKSGKKALPIEAVGDYGFRIAIPQKTFEKKENKEQESLFSSSDAPLKQKMKKTQFGFKRPQTNQLHSYKIMLFSIGIISLFSGLYYYF